MYCTSASVYDKLHITQIKKQTTHNTLCVKNNIHLFDLDEYIFDILSSYDFNIAKINKQFTMDVNIQTVTFNNIIVKSLNDMKYYLHKYRDNSVIINNRIVPFVLVCKALCTQASFAYIYGVMESKYGDRNRIYVTSKETECMLDDINNKKINIQLVAKFNIRDIIEDRVLGVVTVMTHVEMKVDGVSDRYGFMMWSMK